MAEEVQRDASPIDVRGNSAILMADDTLAETTPTDSLAIDRVESSIIGPNDSAKTLAVGPLVTLAVSVRNGLDFIDDCMLALTAQSWRPLEIIAVDDGSSDGGTERLLKWHDPDGESDQSNGIKIRVITQSALGLSAGRNAALRESVGEWFAITDIDCRPSENWIEQMMEVRCGMKGERVVAVTGRTIFAEGDTRVSHLRSAEIERKYRGRSRLASLANGPCSMFCRETLATIGGFDPDWYHAEDMQVSMRLLSDGGTILHTPYAVVNHIAEESLRVFLGKRRRDARAHIRIVRSHGIGGALGPDGIKVGHDFTGDAKIAAMIFPLHIGFFFLLLGILEWLELPNFLASFPPALLAGFLLILSFLVDRDMPVRLLWSLALWWGVAEGWLDAVLARNGHRRIFTRRE